MNKNNKITLGVAVVVAFAVVGLFLAFSMSGSSPLGLNLFGKNSSLNNPLSQGTENQTDNSVSESSGSGDLGNSANLPPGVRSNNLKPIDGKQGSATFVTVNDGKNFAVVIEAKLPDPAANQSYYAWLGISAADKNLMQLGKLQKNNDKYTLSFNQVGDFSKYKDLIITSESNNDNTPETRVLEGAI